MSTGAGPANGAAEAAERPQVSSARLLTTLGGAGALAGGLIVIVFSLTQPAIEAHRARRLEAAITEVLRGPAGYDTLYVVDGRLTEEPPQGADPRSLERVFRGRSADGSPAGYAVVARAPGFADIIEVIFGYDPDSGKLLGMKVLESKETPGLGDKIEKDPAFVGQFEGLVPPLEGMKAGRGAGGDSGVDLITGATISSRTVVRIINDAMARLGPQLEAAGAGNP